MDYTTPVGQVRLLIADVDTSDQLISDTQLEGYLTLNDGSVRRAAADALEAIAASEVLVSKRIRTQDLQTDGPAVAKVLREQAATFRALADDAEGGFVDVIEFTPYPTVG